MRLSFVIVTSCLLVAGPVTGSLSGSLYDDCCRWHSIDEDTDTEEYREEVEILNTDDVQYCICNEGASRGFSSLYNVSNSSNTDRPNQALSKLVREPSPTLYSVSLAGGRFNTSVCYEARLKAAALYPYEVPNVCGVQQLRPMDAFKMGYTDCGDFLTTIIDSVLHKTGGAFLSHRDQWAYISPDRVTGDWPWVAHAKTAVSFTCQREGDVMWSGESSCRLPCPKVEISLYSLSSTFRSCPYAGSSTIRLKTTPLPISEYIIRMNSSYGSEDTPYRTDVWGVYDEWDWVELGRQVPPKYVYEMGITNDLFDDRFHNTVHGIIGCMAAALVCNVLLLLSFFTSLKQAMQRPFDLVAAMVVAMALFETNVLVWASTHYKQYFVSACSHAQYERIVDRYLGLLTI